MSSCPLDAERVEALLRGALADAEGAALREHLRRPCEQCLERLEGEDGLRILEALGGEEARLSGREREELFAASLPSPEAVVLPLWRRASTFVPVLAAAALLGAVIVRGMLPSTEPYQGMKTARSSAVASPGLTLVVGTVSSGVPRVDRILEGGEPVGDGEVLLFRYRLESAAFVSLFAKGQDGAGAQLLWASEAQLPAGEREIAADGQVLSLHPAAFGHGLELALVASAAALPAGFVSGLPDLRVESLLERCESCAVATRSVRVAEESR